MKKILILTLVVYFPFTGLADKIIDKSFFKAIDMNGNEIYLSQDINEIIKLYGLPDSINEYPFEIREKNEYDYYDYFYNIGLLIGFYKYNSSVDKIVLSGSFIGTLKGYIHPNAHYIDKIIEIYGTPAESIIKDEYKYLSYYQIFQTSDKKTLGEEYKIQFKCNISNNLVEEIIILRIPEC